MKKDKTDLSEVRFSVLTTQLFRYMLDTKEKLSGGNGYDTPIPTNFR